MSQLVEETIFALLSQVREPKSTAPNGVERIDAGASISPNDVARAIDAENWRRELPKVRAVVIGLARQGRLEVLRKGKPVDPNGFKGIYRLRVAQ